MVKREHIAVYEGTFGEFRDLRKVFAKQGVFEGRNSDDAAIKHMIKIISENETIRMMLEEIKTKGVETNENTI